MSWSRRFEAPIEPDHASVIITLRDAGEYISALPKAVARLEHCQLACQQVLDAAEGRNFPMHARIAVMKALNHGKPVAETGAAG